MEEYKIGPAIVRMHGKPDPERLKAASERFMQQIMQRKKYIVVKTARNGKGEGR